MLGNVALRMPWLVPTPEKADSGSSFLPEAFHWKTFLAISEKTTLVSLYLLINL